MAIHNERGKNAEEIASQYLASIGYKILNRNWRYYQKEIDIVAEKDSQIIIVEVKSRSGKDTVSADELITFGKMRNLVSAAEAYINKYNIEKEIRFDVMIINHDEPIQHVEHITGAFTPGANW